MFQSNQCCGDFKEKVDCTTETTDKGIVIKIEPKDPAKVESFQKMIQGCKDFCDCCN